MPLVDRFPWKLGNNFVDANVPGKPYTHENDRRNDTSDTDMAELGRERSKMRCWNAAMGGALLQED